MKISKQRLKQIIKEEMRSIYEQDEDKVNSTQKLALGFKELYNKFANAGNDPNVKYSSREIEEFIKLIRTADVLISGQDDKASVLMSLNKRLEGLIPTAPETPEA